MCAAASKPDLANGYFCRDSLDYRAHLKYEKSSNE